MPQRIFLLSPADCGGKRARLLLNREAEFPLAVRLREAGAPLGEIFSFLSALYFRGKLTYARAFARATAGSGGVLVITPGRGLVSADAILRLGDLQAIAAVGVTPDEPRYRDPLERDALALTETLGADDDVVLLGSIATGKYADVLEGCLDGRLRFPLEFVGRGDMSRGGLMLRCVIEGQELNYGLLAGARRTGKRPPKLAPLK